MWRWKKVLGRVEAEFGCRTICATRWSISCGAGRTRPRLPPDGATWWAGPAWRAATSSTGKVVTARPTNTTAGFRATTGWRHGEEKAIIDFHQKNPLEGYRRLTFMMLDADIVAVSPSSVYRVLAGAGGLLGIRNWSPSKKGTGFVQPLKPHEHWHVDVS